MTAPPAPKKVLYFIAGNIPTTNEAADIAWLTARQHYNVQVRTVLKDVSYTSPETPTDVSSLETADFAACQGSIIPAAYSGVTVLTIPQGGSGLSLVIGPAALSFLHTTVSQMAAFTLDANEVLTDVTANAGMVWTSGTPATATIAAGGKLTGVAAGTTLVTATLTIGGKTIVATETVTCT